jgi:hypothetical protein
MDEESIIRLAQEAGIYYREIEDEFCEADKDGVPIKMMAKFAALVTAAEREACAKIADDEANDAMTAGEHNPKSNAAWNISMTAKRVADAIRARSGE